MPTNDIFQQVHRLACELYDARDEDDHRRDLEKFEQDFLTSVKNADTAGHEVIRGARNMPGIDADYIERLKRLVHRQKERELRNALLIYRDAKDRRDNPAAYDDEELQQAAE